MCIVGPGLIHFSMVTSMVCVCVSVSVYVCEHA